MWLVLYPVNGAASLQATAADYARFLTAFIAGGHGRSLLDARTAAEMPGITLGWVASSYGSSTGGKPHAANSSGSTNVVSSTTRPSASSDMTVRQTAW